MSTNTSTNTPTENQEKENNDVTSNRRQLRANVRDRIRNRIDTRNDSGDSTGSSTGSSTGTTGASTNGTTSSSEVRNVGNTDTRVDNRSETEQRSDVNSDFSLRITNGNTDRGNNHRERRTRNNSDRDISASRNDRGNNEQTESLSTTIPVISSEKIFSDEDTQPRQKRKYTRRNKTGTNTLDLIKPLKIACKFVFDLPVTIGWGNHWSLEDDEANDLAICLRDVLDAFPSKTTKDFIRQLERWIPLVSLAVTFYGITAPRVMLTRQLLQQQKLEQLKNAENQQREKNGIHQFVN